MIETILPVLADFFTVVFAAIAMLFFMLTAYISVMILDKMRRF